MVAMYLLPLMSGDVREWWWLVGWLLGFGIIGYTMWPTMLLTIRAQRDVVTVRSVVQAAAASMAVTIGLTLLGWWLDHPVNPVIVVAYVVFAFVWGAAFRRFVRSGDLRNRSHA
ncbi:MAG: hypothetical protein M3354_12265 [Chloroflexota bacterium]|nr:hypothetical protein [Chloroflexota bacterium]